MKPVQDNHAALHGGFHWRVPRRFNIAQACCTRWARQTPDAVAIRWEHEDGRRGRVTYAQLQAAETNGDRALLDSLITNLIDNAIRFNRADIAAQPIRPEKAALVSFGAVVGGIIGNSIHRWAGKAWHHRLGDAAVVR